MKTLIFLAPLLLSFFISFGSTANATSKADSKSEVKTKSAKAVKQTAKAGKKAVKDPNGTPTKLGTSFKFDGSALRGKYNSSLNTKATVENDKLLEDLLAGRTEFNDREEQDQGRN